MTELRFNPLLGRWVTVAAERMSRPSDFVPRRLPVEADPGCKALHADKPLLSEMLVLGEGQAIANVLVHVVDDGLGEEAARHTGLVGHHHDGDAGTVQGAQGIGRVRI